MKTKLHLLLAIAALTFVLLAPAELYAAPLFSDDFEGQPDPNFIDSTKWDQYDSNNGGFGGGTGKVEIVTEANGNNYCWIHGSKKTAIHSKQSFTRGNNLRVTFQIWGGNNKIPVLYGPWQGEPVYDFVQGSSNTEPGYAEYDGLFHVVGGLIGSGLPPERHNRGWWYLAQWSENNTGYDMWGGSQDCLGLDRAFQDATFMARAKTDNTISYWNKMELRIWLGDTAGGKGQWRLPNINGGAWNDFKDWNNGNVVDTRPFDEGSTWTTTGMPLFGPQGRHTASLPGYDGAPGEEASGAVFVVNGTSEVWLGFNAGDGANSGNSICIDNLVVENDLNLAAETPTPTPPPVPTPLALATADPGVKKVLYVTGAAGPTAGDTKLIDRCTALGYTVTTIGGNTVTTNDAAGKSVVIIASAVHVPEVDNKFYLVNIPVICWEVGLMDPGNLNMTYNVDPPFAGTDASLDLKLVIDDASHPLAAGFPAGAEVTFAILPDYPRFGNPTAEATGAIKVAHIKSYLGTFFDEHVGIFAYDKGGMMEYGLPAPARRVALPLGDGETADAGSDGLTAEGGLLFDAAVNWAAATPTEPVNQIGRRAWFLYQ